MTGLDSTLTFNADELHFGSWGWQRFVEQAFTRDWHADGDERLVQAYQLDRASDVGFDDLASKLGPLTLKSTAAWGTYGIAEPASGCLVYLQLEGDNDWRVVTKGPEAEAWHDKIDQWLPELESTDEWHAPITFWVLTPNGPESRTRWIDVNPWREIAGNYPNSTPHQLCSKMSGLMDAYQPTGGKLLLWHGPPGTGKTHCIRALASSWREWCSTSYIVDPDEFFEKAAYMMNVLLAEPSNDRWRLFVIEDADEFLKADAKQRAGQQLSRLLNAADGLIGQGLKVLFLITTNEPLSNIHPAVRRQGRCLANVTFPLFTRAEAVEWLRRRGSEERPEDGDLTLAKLYDIIQPAHLTNTAEYNPQGLYA